MEMSLVATLFPGIASLFVQDPVIACARIFMIIFGFILAYLGFKRTLEPLIMVPMGVGMICINCGVLFLDGGKLGTLFLDPLVSEPGALMNIMQINFLQPIYNLTFSNSLVACLVFMGIGAMCEIGFILANPWTSIIIAIFAEAGTFVTLILGVNLGLTPPEAAAVASIGGADGPMVLFTSLMLAPELFVPISVIAYLYLSLTYAGYPTLVKMLVPKKYRGIDIIFDAPEIPKTKKFIFILSCSIFFISTIFIAPSQILLNQVDRRNEDAAGNCRDDNAADISPHCHRHYYGERIFIFSYMLSDFSSSRHTGNTGNTNNRIEISFFEFVNYPAA
jgi:carboxybiotin decarboxylase